MPVVSVERDIEVGKRFFISPSHGFFGIEDGVIEVIELCKYEELVKEDPNVQTLVDNDLSLVTSTWVVFGYVNSKVDDIWYPLPLELFAEHISVL
ncbi:hypothetical protein [Salipaludibacillus sp. CF4.18]|uniref:hypothetical protein n=1 Tax=Salipaludibacillus sp. CF4.18 TaxID=3373081 RepID=UPI003EE6F550